MNFVESLKYAKAHPDVTFDRGLTCWWSCTGAEIMEQFHRSLDRKINHFGGESWRNEETPEEIDMRRDARDLQQWHLCHIRPHLRTPALRKRFAHLLSSED